MTPGNLSLIWAQDSAGVIGINGRIPWSVPEDLWHFQQLTIDNCVVMGTKTYLSLPAGGLSRRINIVIGKTYAERSWIINFISELNSIETIHCNPADSLQDILETHSIVYHSLSHVTAMSHAKEFFSATLFFPDIVSWWEYQPHIAQLSGAIFIIGGENIYTSFMPLAQRLYITYIACESLAARGENEIHAIAYAPHIPADFAGEWDIWEQSSSGLYYRYGIYERKPSLQ